MSENNTFQEIADAIRAHDSFIVLSHIRPDGDAIGSQIALGHALEQMGKTVHYINEDGTPETSPSCRVVTKFKRHPRSHSMFR